MELGHADYTGLERRDIPRDNALQRRNDVRPAKPGRRIGAEAPMPSPANYFNGEETAPAINGPGTTATIPTGISFHRCNARHNPEPGFREHRGDQPLAPHFLLSAG